MKSEKPDKNELRLLKEALEEGASNMGELILATGVDSQRIKQYVQERLIEIPWVKKRVPKGKFRSGKLADHSEWFDAKIREPNRRKTYQSVADDFGREFGESITKEAFWQYVHGTNQEDTWKDSKGYTEDRLRQELLNPILNLVIERAREEGYESVLIRYLMGNRSGLSFDLLERDIEEAKVYIQAKKEKGRDLRRSEIGRLFSIDPKRSSTIQATEGRLRRYGLTEREISSNRKTTKKEKEAIKRCYP